MRVLIINAFRDNADGKARFAVFHKYILKVLNL